ncbi:GntR family transcriptional regulator [Thalassotalea mangrovi]|uniref:GntR family transcriptional regulator n=1 Tax=Thalassotalea mangrovi TaxID=2572245 RepID=A0A4U1B1Y2_9GAMM|nr:GntR family transcriptional regulator [Thalassotalea mangrovi]TKB43280.1 GntR family transcriptional regulator [Thalassotalea mangrovi]
MTNINSSKPKYLQIAEQLIEQIQTRVYPIGSLLPTEKELCNEYQISRHTAREALRHIVQLGLVERRQGSGTRVKREALPSATNPYINSVDDLLTFGNSTRFEIYQAKVLPLTKDIAEQLQLPQPGKYLDISGVRFEAKSRLPLCYCRLYMRIDETRSNQEITKDNAIYALINAINSEPIHSVAQQVSACLMDNDVSELLDSNTSTPAMNITRRYHSNQDNGVMLVATSIYPGDRFTLNNVLYPDSHS